jgi:hypothetical protein
VPAASLFGRKDDRARTLRVTRGPVLPAERRWASSRSTRTAGGARGVRAAAGAAAGAGQAGRVEPVLLGAGRGAPDAAVRDALTLEQLGVRVRPVAARGALSVESASGFVSPRSAPAATGAAAAAGLEAAPVLTYLANELRVGDRAVPYFARQRLAPEPLRPSPGPTRRRSGWCSARGPRASSARASATP